MTPTITEEKQQTITLAEHLRLMRAKRAPVTSKVATEMSRIAGLRKRVIKLTSVVWPQGEYLTTKQVAAILACTPITVLRLINERDVDGHKIGRDWVITAHSVRSYLKRLLREAAQEGIYPGDTKMLSEYGLN